MAMRGRPRLNGIKPGWMLIRDLIAQEGFDRARRNGDKYDDAISEAISTVHEWFHEMPISKTEVKRVLAKRRSSELEETMLATNDVAEVSEASPPKSPHQRAFLPKPQGPSALSNQSPSG